MQKDTNFEHKEQKYAPPLRSENRIGNTTLNVNSFFSEQVKDGVVSKIERLLKDDVKRKVTTN